MYALFSNDTLVLSSIKYADVLEYLLKSISNKSSKNSCSVQPSSGQFLPVSYLTLSSNTCTSPPLILSKGTLIVLCTPWKRNAWLFAFSFSTSRSLNAPPFAIGSILTFLSIRKDFFSSPSVLDVFFLSLIFFSCLYYMFVIILIIR